MTERENKKDAIVSIKDLSIYYITREMGTCKAVEHFSLDILHGETIGLVGETGAGKTTVALGILGLIQSPPGKVMNGSIEYEGKNLFQFSEKEMRAVRGHQISMIFQDPMTALNPVHKVGEQVAEVIRLHQNVDKQEAQKQAEKMLETVGISNDRYNEYPHQFSGGMKQRVVIAMALACSPKFLIADEPTTALDVTIQAQVLDMMNELKEKMNTSVLLITHDLGVVAEMCNRVAIMYAGEIVELGTTWQIFEHTSHPYTRGLIDSLPSLKSKSRRLKPIEGLMPDPSNLAKGCKFGERCRHCTENCVQQLPELVEIEDGHWVRCFHDLYCADGEVKA